MKSSSTKKFAKRHHQIVGVESALHITENAEGTRWVRFTYKGRQLMLCSLRGGKVEVYDVRADGLEMFLGYVNDVAPSEGVYDLYQIDRNPLRGALAQAWVYEGARQWSGRRCDLRAMFEAA